jgi:hypothetical protein
MKIAEFTSIYSILSPDSPVSHIMIKSRDMPNLLKTLDANDKAHWKLVDGWERTQISPKHPSTSHRKEIFQNQIDQSEISPSMYTRETLGLSLFLIG